MKKTDNVWNVWEYDGRGLTWEHCSLLSASWEVTNSVTAPVVGSAKPPGEAGLWLSCGTGAPSRKEVLGSLSLSQCTPTCPTSESTRDTVQRARWSGTSQSDGTVQGVPSGRNWCSTEGGTHSSFSCSLVFLGEKQMHPLVSFESAQTPSHPEASSRNLCIAIPRHTDKDWIGLCLYMSRSKRREARVEVHRARGRI